jgi:hypothetical protein
MSLLVAGSWISNGRTFITRHFAQNRANRSSQPFGSTIVPSGRIPSRAQTKFAPQNSIDEKEEKL